MANGDNISLNKIYDAIVQLSQKVENLNIGINELMEEREVSQEYKEKLQRISKQKGKTFATKEEFLAHIKSL